MHFKIQREQYLLAVYLDCYIYYQLSILLYSLVTMFRFNLSFVHLITKNELAILFNRKGEVHVVDGKGEHLFLTWHDGGRLMATMEVVYSKYEQTEREKGKGKRERSN